MISLSLNGCRVDVLPVVNGLSSEAKKVRDAYGNYEAYGASMGIEGLEALRKRSEIDPDDMETSELDEVYAYKMAVFGDVHIPSPAFCELVDLCAADGMNVIALDMSDQMFDDAYLKNVKALDFVSAHRTAKKGLKKKMDMSSPEAFSKEWDAFVNKRKGFERLENAREKHIASEIADTAKYRKSLLAVVEVERVDGVLKILKEAMNDT